MQLRCPLSPSLQPVSPGWFPSRNIITDRRRTFDEFEPSGRPTNRKLDFNIERLQPRHAGNCCDIVLTRDSRTELQDRNLLLNYDREVNLINIEESTNGFVLFKFGMADSCEDPSMFLSSTEREREPSAISSLSEYVSEVIESPAFISRNVDDAQELQNKNLASFDFAKGLHDFNLSRDLTSSPMGQTFESMPFFECPNEGSSSFGSTCTSGNISEEPIDEIPTPDLAKTELDPNKLLSLSLIFGKGPQPVNSPGCFSPGIEGSGIITTVGHDGLHVKSSHGVKVHFADESVHEGMYSAIMMVENKALPVHCCHEDAGIDEPNFSSQVARSVKATATKRMQRAKKKGGLGQKKSGKVVTRDIFRRNSFHLYEIMLSYPFTNSSQAVLNFQTVPKEEFGELFNIFNQIAVGLAGSGLALVLFVASRMLSLNAPLDSSKFMYLLRGIGLLWLSSALHKFGGVVRCMADVCTEAKSQRKEHLATLRREVQAIAFKACTVVMLSMVRLV